jgi:hypothetical protein
MTLLLYPQLMNKLLQKIAKKQLTQKFSKSWYEGYQKLNWKEIL